MTQEKFRRDYVAPHYVLTNTNLDFTLDPEKTIVKAELKFTAYDTAKELVLNGDRSAPQGYYYSTWPGVGYGYVAA